MLRHQPPRHPRVPSPRRHWCGGRESYLIWLKVYFFRSFPSFSSSLSSLTIRVDDLLPGDAFLSLLIPTFVSISSHFHPTHHQVCIWVKRCSRTALYLQERLRNVQRHRPILWSLFQAHQGYVCITLYLFACSLSSSPSK